MKHIALLPVALLIATGDAGRWFGDPQDSPAAASQPAQTQSLDELLLFFPAKYPVGNLAPQELRFETSGSWLQIRRACMAGSVREVQPGRRCSSFTGTPVTSLCGHRGCDICKRRCVYPRLCSIIAATVAVVALRPWKACAANAPAGRNRDVQLVRFADVWMGNRLAARLPLIWLPES